MEKESLRKIWIVTIFAIAMGFLEAVVVVYLRKLFYPQGFDFPLVGFVDPSIISIEWIREFATVVMLIAIGCLAGKKAYEKFAYFIYAFAIWDIFYYVFLKATLDWPASLMTWDLLFLIPWPWVGPVIAPVICSILLIAAALLIIHFQDTGRRTYISAKEWVLLTIGMILVLYTWLRDYYNVIFGGGFGKEFFTLADNSQFYSIITSYIPMPYNYTVFWLGIIVTIVALLMFIQRTKRKK